MTKTLSIAVPNKSAKKLSARETTKRSNARKKHDFDRWRRKLAQDRQREFEHGVLSVTNILDDKNYRAFLSPYVIRHAAELQAFRKEIESRRFSEYCGSKSKNRKFRGDNRTQHEAWSAFDLWSLGKAAMPSGMLRRRSARK